jgi:hypothetical protein
MDNSRLTLLVAFWLAFTAELHSLEESTVRRWIKDLDYDNDQFFIKIRELVYKAAMKAGPTKTSELFNVPETTVKILLSEYNEIEFEGVVIDQPEVVMPPPPPPKIS